MNRDNIISAVILFLLLIGIPTLAAVINASDFPYHTEASLIVLITMYFACIYGMEKMLE